LPDFYQGAELWDLSLVDPDNRRPVDYQTRIKVLEEILTSLARNRSAAMLEMLERWRDGRIKLAIIAILLGYRRDQPELFARGDYEPITAVGGRADQICAFARRGDETAMIVVARRYPVRCEADPNWCISQIAWPRSITGDGVWRDLLTGRRVERDGEAVPVGAVLETLPVAVLVPQNGNLSL
jgi:(1->4)-alpha-D-glucan 1-alpha-D-glucosylmutase